MASAVYEPLTYTYIIHNWPSLELHPGHQKVKFFLLQYSTCNANRLVRWGVLFWLFFFFFPFIKSSSHAMPKIDFFFLSDIGSCCIRLVWAYREVKYRQSNGQCQQIFFFYHIAVCILVRRTHQLLKHSLQALSSDILNGCNHALELVWNARNARSKQADWAQRKLMSFQRLSVLPELRLSIFSSKECSYLLREGFLLSQIIFLPLGQ